ncbi:MAG: hypothetical protein JO337_08430 [Acidimicrobiales bacterium]|nr:hypothetical protein [Acidimicrobiales bacterium]
MTPVQAAVPQVRVDDLRIGDLLAEGGEGRVFLLPLQPHLVYKAYRRPVPAVEAEDLVAWLRGLPSTDPDAAARVAASAAWPCAVVVGGTVGAEGTGDAAGVLMPRAPRRFSIRHRDGNTRLASLSYLTADPAHRAAAYGVQLPPAVSRARIALVCSLARLLAALEAGNPSVGHGDLSTKNVLWSLQRGPEMFVIDCDSSECYARDGSGLAGSGLAGSGLAGSGRRRAMTPNWDDPAVARGGNPTPMSDRYSLALIFLRVVGAANFPIQARQRSGEMVSVDFAVPAGPGGGPLLDPGHPVWDLCARGLSVADPAARPPASAWVPVLEGLLEGTVPIEAHDQRPGPAPGDVVIRPALVPHRRNGRAPVAPGFSVLRPRVDAPAGGGLRPWANPTAPGPATPSASGPSVWSEVRAGASRSAGWWLEVHGRMVTSSMSASRRAEGVRLAVFCGLLDLALLLVGLFVVAMVVSPVIGL